MDEEIASLLNNNTWELVPAPENRKLVSNKWVFKIKDDTQGQKFKARLVGRGFLQKFGTDYDQVFAPVVKQTTFRTLLTIAGQRKMIIKHYDAKTAFLNGTLQETIYMNQPDGYEVQGKENMVCRLIKSIYGLKQAVKVWNERLDKVLKEHCFIQSEADPCLYFKRMNNKIIFIVVNVNDLLIAGETKEKIELIAKSLNEYFHLTDLGLLKCYLGIQIERKEKFLSLSRKVH